MVWGEEQAAGAINDAMPDSRSARCRCSCGPVERRTGRRAPARTAAVLQRAPRAMGDFARCSKPSGRTPWKLKLERRVRSRPPRTAPAPPHQGKDLAMSQPLPFRLDRESSLPRRATPCFAISPTASAGRDGGAPVDDRRDDPVGPSSSGYPTARRWTGHVVALDPTDAIAFTYGYRSGAPIPRAPRSSPYGWPITKGARRCNSPTSSRTTARATSTCRVGATRWRSSPTSRPTRCFGGAALWWTRGSTPGRTPTRHTRGEPSIAWPHRISRSRDQFSLVTGLGTCVHTGRGTRFMPGLRLSRDGAVRHCQGTVLADWVPRERGPERGAGMQWCSSSTRVDVSEP
jgi:hypothetical protein